MSHWPYCLQLIPINSGGTPIGDVPFTRTGLLGFVGPVSNNIVDFVAFWKHLCLYLLYIVYRSDHLRLVTLPVEQSLSVSCNLSFIEKNSFSVPSGKFGVCGWKDRGSAFSQWAQTQCRRPGGHRAGGGASQNHLQREVRMTRTCSDYRWKSVE